MACRRGAAGLARRGTVSSCFSYVTRVPPPQHAPAAPAATIDRRSSTGLNSHERASSCGKKAGPERAAAAGVAASSGGDPVGNNNTNNNNNIHRTEFSWAMRGSLNPVVGSATVLRNPVGGAQLKAQFARGYASDGELPPHQEIGMPSLSPTMTQGNIAGWKRKEGDKVMAGDVLCEIETDKATLEMESMEEGYLAKIVVGDGAKDIKVGEVICIVVENEDDIPKFSNYQPSGSSGGEPQGEAPKTESAPPPPPPPQEPAESKPPPPKPAESKSPPPPSSSSGGRIFASPAAKKLAADKNVPLDSIRGTGPDGHIVKADIEDYLASGSPQAKQEAPVASTGEAAPARTEGSEYSDISINDLQKATARRLVQSKQTIPHYYLTLDTRIDKILELQEQLNQSQVAAKREKLSIIDFVIKAAALAARKVPEVNSSWTDEAIRQYHNVNISVAIQSEQMVPVVKDADRKGLSAISEEIKVLVEKASSNSLQPSEYQGGTFAVTYLGEEHGVKQFSAILHPPQSCVLAVGKTEKRVIPGLEAGQFVLGTYMSVTMSCDHRVVDGAIGALWLGAFKEYIEEPVTLLL